MTRFIEELGRELSGRLLDIWDGTAEGITEETRQKYIKGWKTGWIPDPPIALPKCSHLGASTGRTVGCRTCNSARLLVFECAKHGRTTIEKSATETGIACCRTCEDNPINIAKKNAVLEIRQHKRQTTNSLPVKMVWPHELRSVWKNGILQIWITRACDRSCYGCTQGSNLAGEPGFMSPDQFRVAAESLRDYFGVVGIFGGNPCLHPQFDEICSILRGIVPFERRGLWSNHPKGKGRTCAITFNPRYSNLNVHESQEAYDEFARDWPECRPYLKGLDSDSRHSPPFVAMKDVIQDETERWQRIANCDINKNWSALIGVFRGMLRGWFCEIAGSQSMLHQHEPNYPDTGVPVTPGWWRGAEVAFAEQVRKHCHECGIPLRGYGERANAEDGTEQVTETHAGIYRPKRFGRRVEVITELIQLGKPLTRTTDYIENGAIQ